MCMVIENILLIYFLNKVSIELCNHIMDYNQIPNNWYRLQPVQNNNCYWYV